MDDTRTYGSSVGARCCGWNYVWLLTVKMDYSVDESDEFLTRV